jgi:hypothetical protein
MIACMETIKLERVEYDKEAAFLALLPPQCLGHVDVQELTGRFFEGLPHDQALARHGRRNRAILRLRFARKEKQRIVRWDSRETPFPIDGKDR